MSGWSNEKTVSQIGMAVERSRVNVQSMMFF